MHCVIYDYSSVQGFTFISSKQTRFRFNSGLFLKRKLADQTFHFHDQIRSQYFSVQSESIMVLLGYRLNVKTVSTAILFSFINNTPLVSYDEFDV